MADTDTADTEPSPEPEPDSQVELAVPVQDDDASSRAWVDSIVALLAGRAAEQDDNEKLQRALDRMYVAAAQRLERIMRSDIVA